MHAWQRNAIASASAALAVAVALGACGRTLESCAAYLAILGPTTVTLTCPPAGFRYVSPDITEEESHGK